MFGISAHAHLDHVLAQQANSRGARRGDEAGEVGHLQSLGEAVNYNAWERLQEQLIGFAEGIQRMRIGCACEREAHNAAKPADPPYQAHAEK